MILSYRLARAWDNFVSGICFWLVAMFPGRCRVIPHAEDPTKSLLLQFMVWPKHLYLQHFLSPESPEWYHKHRWGKMRSFVLSGRYIEHRPLERRHILHNRLTTYSMTRDVIHHVVWWSPVCWTLFWVREASDDWGYYPERAFRSDLSLSAYFVPWRYHIQQRVPNIETKQVTK